MFRTETYETRRNELKKLIGSGVILFPGNNEMPFNYASNPYYFRQDSSFLYYFGLDSDALFGIIDVDNNRDILFGNDREIEDVVWMGPESPLSERALLVGIKETYSLNKLDKHIKKITNEGRKIHYLPQYRHDIILMLESLLGIGNKDINSNTSLKLTKAVIKQRSLKSDEEISEMEKAVNISYLMNTTAMKITKPGMIEREVFGVVEGIALSKGSGVSFPIIFSIRGETLHNHHHDNTMKAGDLAILDSGAESSLHYASDITRTYPVSGYFSSLQKDLYNTVLKSQIEAIKLMKPGVPYKEIHLNAVKIITEGLIDLGLMKGDPDKAVESGAHALFMPHGLGHLIGLDVHDMEGLGEDLSGYDDELKRSKQFGLGYLRFGKKLESGMVLTVEPGIYFIPQLIENWKSENKHTDFINYGKTEAMIGFGGIRIEDDVLVTQQGGKVLGKSIPKTVEDIEAVCNS